MLWTKMDLAPVLNVFITDKDLYLTTYDKYNHVTKKNTFEVTPEYDVKITRSM